MVTNSTRGVSGHRASISRSTRAVVDFPTATDPATPMTNGVRDSRSPRNVEVTRCSAPVPPTYRLSRRDNGRIDGVHLGQVDRITQPRHSLEFLPGQRQGCGLGQRRPLRPVQFDVGRHTPTH